MIVHLPKDKQAQKELENRVAAIHAQAVLDQVKRLACPLAQKLDLIKAVQDSLRRSQPF